ncbi:hypothetical protein VN0324_03390 [Helicobacter pylori]|nr:hypothetical protein VN0324_03390 [Helicobacter pylori]
MSFFKSLSEKLHLKFENRLLNTLQSLEFTDLGYYLVGLFIIAFLGSFFLWKIKFSKLEG